MTNEARIASENILRKLATRALNFNFPIPLKTTLDLRNELAEDIDSAFSPGTKKPHGPRKVTG